MFQQSKTTSGSSSNPITEGVIWQQLLLFFFPILFGTFFQQLYNTADAVIVGRFLGKQALAAVGGSTTSIINLLIGFFIGLSSGATVIISQYYGAQKADMVGYAVHTAITASIISGGVLTVVGFFGAPLALQAMGTPEDVLGFATLYIRIYFLGTIPNLIYNIGSGILRAVGDSKRPLYFLMASCFTNIVLDILFVILLQFGIAGAAFATIFSQCVSAFLVIFTLTRTQDLHRLVLSRLGLDIRMLKRIIHIGLPSGLQSSMYGMSNVIIQSSINALGTDTVSAWAAYGKIDAIFGMIVSAFGIAITTFVGQNYGAGKSERVRRGIKVCMGMTLPIHFPDLYHRPGSAFHWYAYPAFPGSDLCHLHHSGNLFQFLKRCRRLLETDAHHHAWSLRPACAVAAALRARPPEHLHGDLFLSIDLDDYIGFVFDLPPWLQLLPFPALSGKTITTPIHCSY